MSRRAETRGRHAGCAGAASLLCGLAVACVVVPAGERFLVAPLDEVAPFERTQSRGILDILVDPDFSVPMHLRPCCAFGRDLGVRLARLPLPGVQVRNVVSPEALGQHTYDGGLVSLKHGVREGFVSREENGLVYTCRGGFIDLAHVRDYADWTAFLTRRIESMLGTGVALELPEEGGRRFVFLTAVDGALVESVGAPELAVQLAQWLTFQLSLWHETATWFGWSAIDLFPELSSAFSPEDLYSNLLGIHVASYVIQAGEAESEDRFNDAMDRAIREALRRLGAMPPDATRRGLDAVDGLWWSSKERLPSKRVVLRRYLSIGPELLPWEIPPERIGEALRADRERLCAALPPEPVALRYPVELGRLPFERIARLDLQVEPSLAESLPLPDPKTPWLSQRDLPGIVEHVRVESAREFGTAHDRPSPGPELP